MSRLLLWTARLVGAAIMLQTLYFKFTGAEESVAIFKAVGIEPWGRFCVGTLELIASILLLMPALSWIGAVLALALMAGAIVLHLTILGIESQGDGGQLFVFAIVVSACSLYVLWASRSQVRLALGKLMPG
jgi:putative oxidoreductase